MLEELASPDPRVRRAAVLLLANLQEEEKAQAGLAGALADLAPEVQFTAESVLSSLGDAAIETVLPQLRSERERAVEAALRVVAASGAQRWRELLSGELHHRVRRLWYHEVGLQHLPQDGSLGARFLRAAHEDAARRNRRFAFRILGLLDSPRIIGRVEKALRFGGGRARADALEVLSNLGDRESSQLLVVMHEEGSLEERYRSVADLLDLPGDFQDAGRRLAPRRGGLDPARSTGYRWRAGRRAGGGREDGTPARAQAGAALRDALARPAGGRTPDHARGELPGRRDDRARGRSGRRAVPAAGRHGAGLEELWYAARDAA